MEPQNGLPLPAEIACFQQGMAGGFVIQYKLVHIGRIKIPNSLMDRLAFLQKQGRRQGKRPFFQLFAFFQQQGNFIFIFFLTAVCSVCSHDCATTFRQERAHCPAYPLPLCRIRNFAGNADFPIISGKEHKKFSGEGKAVCQHCAL